MIIFKHFISDDKPRRARLRIAFADSADGLPFSAAGARATAENSPEKVR